MLRSCNTGSCFACTWRSSCCTPAESPATYCYLSVDSARSNPCIVDAHVWRWGEWCLCLHCHRAKPFFAPSWQTRVVSFTVHPCRWQHGAVLLGATPAWPARRTRRAPHRESPWLMARAGAPAFRPCHPRPCLCTQHPFSSPHHHTCKHCRTGSCDIAAQPQHATTWLCNR